MSQIRKQYPDLDIRMFFMNEHVKIPPAKSSTYADWADKNGYKYYTFDKDFGTDECNNEGDAVTDNFGVASCYGQGVEAASRTTPELGTQPKRSTRRSTRTKNGSVQKETKQKPSKGRSSRRSTNSTKDGG